MSSNGIGSGLSDWSQFGGFVRMYSKQVSRPALLGHVDYDGGHCDDDDDDSQRLCHRCGCALKLEEEAEEAKEEVNWREE